jgi:hypothetical protein
MPASENLHTSRRISALIPSSAIATYNLWFDARQASGALSNNLLSAVMQIAA